MLTPTSPRCQPQWGPLNLDHRLHEHQHRLPQLRDPGQSRSVFRISSEIKHFHNARLNILHKHINAAIPLKVLLKLSRAGVVSPARTLKPGALTARAKPRLVRPVHNLSACGKLKFLSFPTQHA